MARYKLEDIFDLQMGKTPSRNNPEYWDSCDNKWISIGDLTQAGKYVTDTKEYISDLAVEESGIKLIPANTVVMSFKLSIGKTAITSGEMYSNEAIMAFHDKHVVELIPEYIYYMFKYKNWDEGTNKAVMGKTLNKATLSKVEIEVCPFEKQKEIVELLDKVSAILEERNDELQKLDDLIKARFVEMFGSYPENEKGWETGTIRDLVTDVRYGSSRKAAEGNQGKYRYLRMNNITYSGELDLTDVKTIDIPDQELDKCVVRKGDLLFNRTNSKELVGKTCVYDRDEQMVLAGFVIRVRLNDRALPEFVSAFLNTDFSKAMLFAKCKAAVGQANINAQEFQNIGIYVPPIEFQKEFVSFKKQVDKSKVAVQSALDKAQLLFDSLMQQYFG
jgi:type I restriction enzyme S subunit